MKLRIALLLCLVVIIVFDVIVWGWSIICILFNTDRAVAIVLGYDRLGNIAMGQGNETISSWVGRHNHWLEKPIDYIFYILTGERNHCDNHNEYQEDESASSNSIY